MLDERLNFIKIVRKLPEISKSRFALRTPQELMNELQAMERVLSRPWLMDKINDLK